MPKVDNFTVFIQAVVRRDDNGQAKIEENLKIFIKIRELSQFIKAEYPPLYVFAKAGEKNFIPFGSLIKDDQKNSGRMLLRRLQDYAPDFDV